MANAEHVEKGESAFLACTKAYIGIDGGYSVTNNDQERYSNLAIQEPGHNMIVRDYHNLDDGEDHDLGEVKSDGTSTPMITFYENGNAHPNLSKDRSGKGDCAEDGSWDGSHQQKVTNCTREAIEATVNGEL